jgi:hypothetical protein
MAEQLSPAAQAILNGFLANWQDVFLEQDRVCIAAALEALADHVVPEQQESPESPRMGNFISHARWIQRQGLRHQILAIAAELRGQDQPSNEERY